MKRVARIRFGTVALLVLLALLTLLVVRVKRTQLMAGEAEDAAVRPVVNLVDMLVRHEYAAVAFLVLVALFAYVTWTVLRAHKWKDEAKPPAKASRPSGTAELR